MARLIVLFLCGKCGRSQMALGWFNRLAGGRRSLGRAAAEHRGQPGGDRVDARNWDQHPGGVPQAVDRRDPAQAADVVVTMGCGDACPIFPGKRYEDWELDDPEASTSRVRPIRDEIQSVCSRRWASLHFVGRRTPVTVWQLTVVLGHIDSMETDLYRRRVNKSIERRAALHAALGEPVRLAIVEDLAADRSPTDLATRHGLPGNLLAHHLDVLELAGLIERHVSAGDRRRRYIRLRHAALRDLVAVSRLGRGAHCSSARTTRLAPSWPPRQRSAPVSRPTARDPSCVAVHPGAVAAAKRAASTSPGPGLVAGAGRHPGGRDRDGLRSCPRGARPGVGGCLVNWIRSTPAARAFDAALAELDRRITAISPEPARPDRGRHEPQTRGAVPLRAQRRPIADGSRMVAPPRRRCRRGDVRGSDPSEREPAAVDAMAEVGIDISTRQPRRWTDDDLGSADIIVTMGCGIRARSSQASTTRTGSCPTPQASPLEFVREVRDRSRPGMGPDRPRLGVPAQA